MSGKRAECRHCPLIFRTVCSSGTGRRRSIGRAWQMVVSKSNQMDPPSSLPRSASSHLEERRIFPSFPFFRSNTNSTECLCESQMRSPGARVQPFLVLPAKSTGRSSLSLFALFFPVGFTAAFGTALLFTFFPSNRYTLLLLSQLYTAQPSWQPPLSSPGSSIKLVRTPNYIKSNFDPLS